MSLSVINVLKWLVSGKETQIETLIRSEAKRVSVVFLRWNGLRE